jgi:cytoskeletal protein CcmA (bactofilin family)
MNRHARIAVLVLCTLAAGAAADERAGRRYVHQQGNDTFVAGESMRVSEPVKGDLAAAGGELRIAAPVSGDLLAVGGMVRLEPAAAQDLYAAGGQVSFDGTVARNARIGGGSVSIGPKARIDGNASLAGGRVEMLGSVRGYLQAAGGRVLIDGRVDGDVEAAAGELELGPQARIGGRLRYRGGAPLKQDPGAQVQGGIERFEAPVRREAGRRFAVCAAAFGVWTLGLMLMAAVLVAALPGFFGRVADAARGRFGWSLLAGFVALVVVPAAAFALLLTIVGIPFAALAVLGYFALLLLGYVAAGIALGDAALKRWLAARASHRGWRAGAAALGVLVIGLLALIPWLGPLVAFLALIAGIGALVLQLKGAPASA